MPPRRRLLVLAFLSLAAAVAAVYALTRPRAPDDRVTAGLPATPTPSPAPPQVAPAFAVAPSAPPSPAEEQTTDARAAPIQPPGSFAEFANPDDRAASLSQMQQQRFESAMDALNRRSAKRAAMASPAPGAR